jgi:tRNA-splicing ligase RtcB
MPTMIEKGLLSWAEDLDDRTIAQAATTARLPFIEKHVALMPDAHLGYGSTVGSVIPTRGAIIPSAVGVDIGCGMIAVDTTLDAGDLPDDLGPLLDDIEQAVPAGVGKGHDHERHGAAWVADRRDQTGYIPDLLHTERDARRACSQFGTLGSGNHFIEVCLDETDHVWVVLHSGSRGVGNQLAKRHIEAARGLMARYFIDLDDPDLAYLVEGTAEFDAYIADLQWAQAYAFANRDRMMDLVLAALADAVDMLYVEVERDRINCHHNYAAREHHMGKNLWVTRKGAIRAREGDRGVIPGSMGAASFIVSGLGHPASFTSASHGAGRRMSRGQARRQIDPSRFTEQMAGRTWLQKKADALLDEAPDAYKDIYGVMSAQADLVTIDHELRQILNFKGA